jgi:hypothetical protein
VAPKSCSLDRDAPLPAQFMYVYWAFWRYFNQPCTGRVGVVSAIEH